MACESFVEHLVGSLYFLQQKIFPNLNVVGHLAVPAGWGSCLPRLAIFVLCAGSLGGGFSTRSSIGGRLSLTGSKKPLSRPSSVGLGGMNKRRYLHQSLSFVEFNHLQYVEILFCFLAHLNT